MVSSLIDDRGIDIIIADIQVRIDSSGWFETDIVKEACGFDTHTKKSC